MAKITYLGDSPTTWAGVYFEPNKAVEVTNPHILKKAPNNPFFKVSGARAEKAEEPGGAEGNEKAKAGGAAAKAAGKDRNVPPSYRGKPSEAAWLEGYDADPAGDA